MSKVYGQDLKKKLEKQQQELRNTKSKINKRFDLILDDYRKYITEGDKEFINNNSIVDLTLELKCDIIMRTEAEYVSKTSNQLNAFE